VTERERIELWGQQITIALVVAVLFWCGLNGLGWLLATMKCGCP
jgi:hypothetical protein